MILTVNFNQRWILTINQRFRY